MHEPRSAKSRVLMRQVVTPAPRMVRRRDSVGLAWSLVLFAFLLAAGLGWLGRVGGF